MANLFRVSSTAILDYVIDNIAEPFDAETPFVKGDYVIYNDLLYVCTAEKGHLGVWNDSNWKRTYLSEISDLLNDIEPTQNGIKKEEQNQATDNPRITNIAALIPYLFRRLTKDEIYINVTGNNGETTGYGGASSPEEKYEGNVRLPSRVDYDSTNGTLTAYMTVSGAGDGSKLHNNNMTAYFIPGGAKDISDQFK